MQSVLCMSGSASLTGHFLLDLMRTEHRDGSGQVLGAQYAFAGSVYNNAPRVSSHHAEFLQPQTCFFLQSSTPYCFLYEGLPWMIKFLLGVRTKVMVKASGFLNPEVSEFFRTNEPVDLMAPWNSHSELLSITAGCLFLSLSDVFFYTTGNAISANIELVIQNGLVWTVWNRLLQLEICLSFQCYKYFVTCSAGLNTYLHSLSSVFDYWIKYSTAPFNIGLNNYFIPSFSHALTENVRLDRSWADWIIYNMFWLLCST